MITSYHQWRSGRTTVITVTSDLVAPPGGAVYIHWYVDGVLTSSGTSLSLSLSLAPGEQVRVDAVDTTDPNFDPLTAPPAGWPARRSLWWIASPDADVRRYRVTQQIDVEDPYPAVEIGTVQARQGQWTYSLLTPRLVDRQTYIWQVIPVDAAGNDGTALVVQERIIRTPDAPNFAATFTPATLRVAFAAA